MLPRFTDLAAMVLTLHVGWLFWLSLYTCHASTLKLETSAMQKRFHLGGCCSASSPLIFW